MKALIVIDVQKEYMAQYESILMSDINGSILQAAENDELVIYIKNVRKLRSEPTTYDFVETLKIVSDKIFYKEKPSAFSNAELINLLNKNNISQIEIVGVDGNSCVAFSAVDGIKFGYDVTLRLNCIGIKNSLKFEKKLADLKERGIRVIYPTVCYLMYKAAISSIYKFDGLFLPPSLGD
ncbi:isochorismatase family protein [Enterococcus sp. HY326]|uniref:isochorismatase family protein n=1 Tax=Enterococcus sp. HY326 TaxID=2971265 RepID=UPI00223F6D01|nr:isochorismatase family protein [Enterococcus sp. HY326]